MHSLIRNGTFLFLRLFCFAFFIDDVTVSDPERIFRAEKGSAQASAHPLSVAGSRRAFLCVDCVCLLLEFWVKCTRCERLLPVKHFYLKCLLFFRRLKILLLYSVISSYGYFFYMPRFITFAEPALSLSSVKEPYCFYNASEWTNLCAYFTFLRNRRPASLLRIIFLLLK